MARATGHDVGEILHGFPITVDRGALGLAQCTESAAVLVGGLLHALGESSLADAGRSPEHAARRARLHRLAEQTAGDLQLGFATDECPWLARRLGGISANPLAQLGWPFR